jgi:hypothetical protein
MPAASSSDGVAREGEGRGRASRVIRVGGDAGAKGRVVVIPSSAVFCLGISAASFYHAVKAQCDIQEGAEGANLYVHYKHVSDARFPNDDARERNLPKLSGYILAAKR